MKELYKGELKEYLLGLLYIWGPIFGLVALAYFLVKVL